MKKIFSLVLLASTLLTACGGSSDSSDNKADNTGGSDCHTCDGKNHDKKDDLKQCEVSNNVVLATIVGCNYSVDNTNGGKYSTYKCLDDGRVTDSILTRSSLKINDTITVECAQ